MVQVIPPAFFPGVSRSPFPLKGETGKTGRYTCPEVSRNGKNGNNGKTSYKSYTYVSTRVII